MVNDINKFMSIIQCFSGAARICTLLAGKEAGFASLEQRSDAWVPVKDVEEELQMMMLLSFPCTILFQMRSLRTKIELVKGLFLFPAFPRDFFFQNGFSSENGFFLSILPRTSQR